MVQSRKHVFVVDDDPAFLTAVMRLIRLAGYEVEGTASITGVCEMLPLPTPSCVLADVILEGESGLDIPDLLRSRGEAAPVVFISATDDATTLEAVRSSSGAPCLKKPVESEDLLDALDAAFGRPSVVLIAARHSEADT